MGIFTNKKRIKEVSFELEKDFEREVFDNYKLLFGKKTILIETKKKISGKSLGATIPDGFLFDLSDEKDPKFYLIEVELVKHSFFNHIFPQITKFFAFFRNQEQRLELCNKLFELIESDSVIKNEFKSLIGNSEIFKFVNDLLDNSQNILIVIDGIKPEFSEIDEVYSDTWGKMVKCIVVRKYTDGRDTIYQVEPEIEVLDIVGDEKVVNETNRYDEQHHTEGVNEEILKIYTELKDKVLDINPNLIFNSTKSYISIRGRVNHTFIQFTKKRMRLVVMRPEDEIRECISSYEIKTFPPSVKRFWNGDCAAIIIEDDKGIDEIIDLIKPLIVENSL